MPDLKAAAERLRKSADSKSFEIKVWNAINASHRQYREFLQQATEDHLLAAQALEALAWQAETGAGVRRKFTGNCWEWACYAPGGRSWFEYVADTPFGALLAAMEGEKDGND